MRVGVIPRNTNTTAFGPWVRAARYMTRPSVERGVRGKW